MVRRDVALSRSTAVLLAMISASVIFGAAPGSASEAPNGASRGAADTTAPTIQQPANMTLASTGPLFSTVSFSVNATDPDNSSSEISIHCDWSTAGVTFAAGTTATVTLSVGNWTMTCSASDTASNTSGTTSFTITVTPYADTTPPVIQVNNQTAPASSAAGTTLYYNVGATDPDNDPSSITVSCDHNLAGGLFPIGITTVTCNAHDPAGNNATPASFTVTVTSTSTTPTTTTTTTTTTTITTTTSTTTITAPTATTPTHTTTTTTTATAAPSTRDTTAPTIRPRPNITAKATSPAGAVVTYTVTATDPDNPAAQIVTSCSPASGSFFRLAPRARTRTRSVTCNANDPTGNTAAPSSFKVTVLGAHDQFIALQAQVTAAANVATRSRSSLALKLVHADLDFGSRRVTGAASQLTSFINAVRVTPRLTRAQKAAWIRAATRISAVIG